MPGQTHADHSIRELFFHFFQRPNPPLADESALAPQVGLVPPAPIPWHELSSRYPQKRLQAVDALAKSGDASPPALAALIRSTRDKNVNVSRHATETLTSLCRAGHEKEVVRALVQAIDREPRSPTHVIHTGYAFRIPDNAEEQRVRAILNGNQ